jgi:hypothetical protein
VARHAREQVADEVHVAAVVFFEAVSFDDAHTETI